MSSNTLSHTQRELIGAWSLTSFVIRTRTANGTKVHQPLGPTPSGSLVYSADGHVSAHLMKPGCPAFNSFFHLASDEELIRAGRSFLGYSGAYSLEMNEGQLLVKHHVDVSSFPNFLDKTVIRAVELRGDTLVLSPAETATWMGEPAESTLEWKKSKGRSL
ncbi:Lipocalin-like domain-containing protein [Aspergillus coremiiformis]|uniref:Lipocalin-like domain-containing protein n=1 Tax=Aspergillus coremiiformis TaxID=138285 RepID=A0A5N6ZBA6_9EURO|nr:Lipocalin-like domain-containing protein [Aspergillus coremiiformis]